MLYIPILKCIKGSFPTPAYHYELSELSQTQREHFGTGHTRVQSWVPPPCLRGCLCRIVTVKNSAARHRELNMRRIPFFFFFLVKIGATLFFFYILPNKSTNYKLLGIVYYLIVASTRPSIMSITILSDEITCLKWTARHAVKDRKMAL